MKSLRCILLGGSAAGVALLIGCATTASTQNRENMLMASGFKVITPKTPAQQQKLQNLPPGKITMIQKAGKTYYIFPDPAHNQAYLGGPKQYRHYQELRATSSTGITRSCAPQTNLPRKIWKPPRCTRIRRCSGVCGAVGTQV